MHTYVLIEVQCQLRPRHDIERHYLITGGLQERFESISSLAVRLVTFGKTFTLEDISTAGLSSVSAEALKALFHSKALQSAADEHGTGRVTPIALHLRVVLPGFEEGLGTEAPTFDMPDAAPYAAYPPWLRVIMRHSKLFEDSRQQTLIAPTWWRHHKPHGSPRGQPGHSFVAFTHGADAR